MKVVPYVSETLDAALEQIHRQLGPDAVVLSVRPVPRQGLARLLPKSRSVEVLACVAEPGEQLAGFEENRECHGSESDAPSRLLSIRSS